MIHLPAMIGLHGRWYIMGRLAMRPGFHQKDRSILDRIQKWRCSLLLGTKYVDWLSGILSMKGFMILSRYTMAPEERSQLNMQRRYVTCQIPTGGGKLTFLPNPIKDDNCHRNALHSRSMTVSDHTQSDTVLGNKLRYVH